MPANTDGRLGETITFRVGLLCDDPLSVSDSSELFNSLETFDFGFTSSENVKVIFRASFYISVEIYKYIDIIVRER